ncbi:hypothetical protein ABZS86_02335 [Streptomyces sp. NPDC005355]|uniref:hypothetical protein n=1 Tax=Streptomyces sp. NPDC005355 TaxID=3157038 RepID=UPI0033BB5328
MMAHTTSTVPALDLRPTGKLPAAVSEAAEREAARCSVAAQFPIIDAFLAEATPEVIQPNPGAPIFAAELSEELSAVVLSLNEDVNLDTPEATRNVGHQAAAFFTRLYALAELQAGAPTTPAGAPSPVTITAPGAAEPLITAEETAARGAFSVALDAIEAAFATSQNPAQTRNALLTAVDMYAAEARA